VCLRGVALARRVLSPPPVTFIPNHSCKILSALSVCVALAFAGCATGGQQIRDPQRAGVWKVRLPASTGVYGLKAMGGSSDDALADARPVTKPNIDEYLKPGYAPKAQPLHQQVAVKHTPASPVVVAQAAPVPAPVAAAPAVAPATQPEQYAMRSEPRPDDVSRYAARDAQSKQAQEFRGGDVVVISVSTLLIIGLIILLIILLT